MFSIMDSTLSHTRRISPRNAARRKLWKRSLPGLYRYEPSGSYFACVRYGGRLYRRSLATDDFQLAKRKLTDFRRDLESTDPRSGNTSFGRAMENFERTVRGAPGTKANKRLALKKIRARWYETDDSEKRIYRLPLRHIKPSDVEAWLERTCGSAGVAHRNDMLSVLRAVFDLAVRDGVISQSPAAGLKYQKRPKPIRLTPTFEQFRALVTDVRAQTFNRDRDDSADFVEFMGLAGLGQAEMASLTRADVDLRAGSITLFRHKTAKAFTVPIFPQIQALVEHLCEGKAHHERLFAIHEARKALGNACKRLGFPAFTHRSLRRMFIPRAIERGVDVKVIAEWQGHRDGGKLILDTYSHVNPSHSQRMARLMSDEEPANVVRFGERLRGRS
jgi:integrase